MRVMLVDDAVLIREGIARLLADAGIDVVAQLDDATQLLSEVERCRPAVVVLDVRMPPTHTIEGLQAASDLKRSRPDVGVLLLSQYSESRFAIQLLEIGHGVGYLLKERVGRADELVNAIRRIADGGSVVDPQVVREVLGTRRPRDPVDTLSERERTVLGLIAEGLSNQAIADRLVLTERTVEAHVRSLFTKLDLPPDGGVHRRVLAVLTHLRAHTHSTAAPAAEV
jgi:DNA-binding NarL/FixJ family response regulator